MRDDWNEEEDWEGFDLFDKVMGAVILVLLLASVAWLLIKL